jgi:NitT/TauT family transport system substrate-binding protein
MNNLSRTKNSSTHVWCLLGCACVWLGFATLVGCSPSPEASAAKSPEKSPSRDRVKLLLNWYPEAEHGGFYAALIHGIFEKHGLDVEILPGGRSSAVTPELVLGRVQFGVGNADDVFLARSEESPLVALMAPLQVGPRCLMVREDAQINSFEQLKNIKLEADTGRPYMAYLKSKNLLDSSVQVVPYFGSIAQLVAGPGTAQQAYSFSEPFLAEQEGVKVRNLMLADVGWNPYACCLLATDGYLNDHPEIAQRMVTACIEGWKKYLTEPEETNAYILKQNQQGMTSEALAFGVNALRPLCLPSGLDEAQLGSMSAERWKSLHQQMVELNLIDPEKVKPEQAFRWPLAK